MGSTIAAPTRQDSFNLASAAKGAEPSSLELHRPGALYLPQSNAIERSGDGQSNPAPGYCDPSRTVARSIDELRKHPIYEELDLTVSAAQLASLKCLGKRALEDPILVTREGVILDGYARWAHARNMGQMTILCVELELDDLEALRVMLSKHRGSVGWNQYNRIRLALRLKTYYRQEARANQQTGGRLKGSSKLTEVSVRRQIARDAGVCEANITKVDQLRFAHPHVLDALATGEIRIHAAWCWRALSPAEQCEQLRQRRMRISLKLPMHVLATGRHSSRHNRTILTIEKAREVLKLLSGQRCLEADSSTLIELVRVDHPGKAVVVTNELYDAFWGVSEDHNAKE